MAQVRTLKWNDLPRTTRDRLSQALARPPSQKNEDDRPILATTVSTRARVTGWAVLALSALAILHNVYAVNLGRLYYAASSMICTPNSLSQEVGLGLGAQAGERRLGEVMAEAGFSRVRRATETPFNLILEARK